MPKQVGGQPRIAEPGTEQTSYHADDLRLGDRPGSYDDATSRNLPVSTS
jgi:hypothetical protein